MGRNVDDMIDFFLKEKGEVINWNGIEKTALVIDVTDKIQYRDDKIIRTTFAIQTGDLIEYRNEKYIIVSQIDHNPNSYRGRIRKCNYSICFNWLGNIKWFDTVIESESYSLDDGKYITLPVGKILVYIKDDSDSRDITLNQRFFHTHQPYRVEGMDRSIKGVVRLTCTIDIINAYDDVANNIVDRWKYEIKHNYTLTIDNGQSIKMKTGIVVQLQCTVKDNGSVVSPTPPITYLSSDSNVAVVDNLGQLMAIQQGQATITARLTYDTDVYQTIHIEVAEELEHNYSLAITGDGTIKLNQSQSYICTIYDNGVEVYDQSVGWNVRNQDNSSEVMATITSSTGNAVTLKAGSKSTYANKYIVLTAVLSNDPTITTEKVIQIKSLF